MKNMDTWPDKFKDEVHNLILSITINGVNPYSQPDNTYTVWHVMAFNNNIPPWLYVNNGHLMLALIVPGRKQVNNMDVYLRPLFKEFKELWEGLHVYDVSRPIPLERSFTLYGICAYTTHDYLGIGFYSGKYII